MNSLVSLLVTAALVFLHNSAEAYPRVNDINDIDNRLEPNEIPPTSNSKRRIKEKYVNISTPPPETIKLTPGSTAVIECVAMGIPPPVIGWMKNGELISDLVEVNNEILSIHQVSIARLVSKLVIREAADGDIFTCVAMSGVLETFASTTVFVDGGESISEPNMLAPEAPIITSFYIELLQTMGTSVTLPCRAYSSTPSQMYWLDNENKPVYSNSRIQVLPSGSLHIANLVWPDMGGYTCTVKNAFGEDSLTTFLLPVKPSKH